MNVGRMFAKNIRKCRLMKAKFWRRFREGEGFKIRSVPMYSFIIEISKTCPPHNTTIVAVVRFGFRPDGAENNFVVTAYQISRQKR
jgi:hypothetical protein